MNNIAKFKEFSKGFVEGKHQTTYEILKIISEEKLRLKKMLIPDRNDYILANDINKKIHEKSVLMAKELKQLQQNIMNKLNYKLFEHNKKDYK